MTHKTPTAPCHLCCFSGDEVGRLPREELAAEVRRNYVMYTYVRSRRELFAAYISTKTRRGREHRTDPGKKLIQRGQRSSQSEGGKKRRRGSVTGEERNGRESGAHNISLCCTTESLLHQPSPPPPPPFARLQSSIEREIYI